MASPYAAPRADTAAPMESEEPVVFSLSARLGRLRYCCYTFGGSVIAGLLAALVLLLTEGLVPQLSVLLVPIYAFGTLFLAVWLITLMVRRMHDMDRAGWWVLLMLVPVVNMLLWFWMLVGAPTPGPNRFGAPLVPNSISVLVFGSIAWVFSMLSVVMNLAAFVLALFAPEFIAEFQGLVEAQS